jgi:hypothetical protein
MVPEIISLHSAKPQGLSRCRQATQTRKQIQVQVPEYRCMRLLVRFVQMTSTFGTWGRKAQRDLRFSVASLTMELDEHTKA